MKEQWLQQGYLDFAKDGPDKLSINQMGQEIGASRSSFYHHFGEIDLFVDALLARHWAVCQEFNQIGKVSCKNLVPDLYELLAAHSVALQFSRQLFHHRHIPRFNYVFVKSYEASAQAFILELFAAHMDLHLPQNDLSHLFMTLGEAWYSRLDPNDLSAATLQHHAEDILQDLANFMGSQVYSTLRKVP
ncbi:MAG: TetR/AcrR family transcriptional regulator [Robiginitalea sp.]|nr:TetR/AcrR family transcriptional regulator [Robiginitalea sp.]